MQRFSISHGVNYVGPLVLYRIGFIESTTFSEGRLQAYVGVGPIYYIDHPESTVNGLAAERYEGSGWGWQAVAGLRYRLTEHWSAFGELKYDQGRATVIVAGDGSANTRLRTGHAIFGVGYTFQPLDGAVQTPTDISLAVNPKFCNRFVIFPDARLFTHDNAKSSATTGPKADRMRWQFTMTTE